MSKWYPTWSKIASKTTPRNTTQRDTTQHDPTQPNTIQQTPHNATRHETTRHETTQNNKGHDTTQEKEKDATSKKYCKTTFLLKKGLFSTFSNKFIINCVRV